MMEVRSYIPDVEVVVDPLDVVILQDHLGLTERAKAMRDAHPRVVVVGPSDKSHPNIPVDPPLDWLSEQDIPLTRKCWLKADAMALAATALAPDADFYWFIESDVAASQDRWKALFHEFRNNPADCLATQIYYRGEDPRMEKYFKDAPPEANRHFIMALYRLSRAAVEASIAEAPGLRECFSEISVPWVMQKHGLKVKRINGASQHFHPKTFRATTQNLRIDKNLINHPCKLNTYGP